MGVLKPNTFNCTSQNAKFLQSTGEHTHRNWDLSIKGADWRKMEIPTPWVLHSEMLLDRPTLVLLREFWELCQVIWIFRGLKRRGSAKKCAVFSRRIPKIGVPQKSSKIRLFFWNEPMVLGIIVRSASVESSCHMLHTATTWREPQ